MTEEQLWKEFNMIFPDGKIKLIDIFHCFKPYYLLNLLISMKVKYGIEEVEEEQWLN